MNFSVIVPVYNEGESISATIHALSLILKKLPGETEIIAVNDGSKDNSLKILQSLKISNLVVVDHIENKGYGASLKTGIRKSKYDIIVITDADGTYPIDMIPKLISYMSRFDMVVGSRVKNAAIPLLRKPVKFVLNHFASYLAGAHIPDLNSGLRCFKKEIAERYWHLFPQKFSFTSTITMCCLTNGYAVKYVPITYYKRKGKSTIHPIKDTLRFFELLIKLSLFFNPNRIFTPIFLVFITLAIARGVRDYMLFDQFGGLALILFFLSFQVLFFSLLATIITKR